MTNADSSDNGRFDGVGVIRTKREGGELSERQIRDLMRAYLAGEFAEEQMSALLMAIFWRGMTAAELAPWTGAMIASGDRIDLSGLSRPSGASMSVSIAAVRTPWAWPIPIIVRASSRAWSRSVMNAPTPTLTSSSRLLVPSATFLDMIELAISGIDSTVAVMSRSA